MFHTLVFHCELLVDLAVSPRKPLERLLLKKGARIDAEVKPYVVETADGLVEVADLFFPDGTSTSAIPFACFSFVDK
jgi:hypothetical protein